MEPFDNELDSSNEEEEEEDNSFYESEDETDRMPRAGWRYDLDDYMQVRLAPTENAESALLADVLSIPQAVQAKCVPEDAYASIMMFAIRQTVFWATIAEKVSLCDHSMVDACTLASQLFRMPERLSLGALLACFNVNLRSVTEQAKEGGLLFSSPSHERQAQLANIDLAVQALLAIDIDSICESLDSVNTSFWTVARKEDWKRDREACQAMLVHMNEKTLPVAFAALWIWKSHIRGLNQWTANEDELLLLWRCSIKLYAIFAPLNDSDVHVCPSGLPGVFHGNVSRTNDMVLETPILRHTLKELWITWSAVTWRTPGLQVGTDFETCLRLMAMRVAYFVSFSGKMDTFDFSKYVRIPDANLEGGVDNVHDILLTVNEAFLRDTERVFFYLFEALFTSQYLEPAEEAPRANEQQREIWQHTVLRRLNTRTASFVQKQLEKHGWVRYTYWDEVERFLRRMHARVTVPRQVLGDFRQNDCDAVFEVLRGKNSLDILWRSADEAVREDEKTREALMGTNNEARGWPWRIAWDVRSDIEKAHGNTTDLPDDIEEVFDEASGESFYVYKLKKNRVRGERLRAIELAQSVRLSAAGLVAKNLLEEIVLKVILQMKGASSTSRESLRVYNTYSYSKALTIMHLMSHGAQPPHEIQEGLLGDFPILLSHQNRYYIFDGETNYASANNFLDALYAWCISCEHVIRLKLDAIWQQLDGAASSDVNEQLLRKAKDIASRVPDVLREMFDLVRDDLLAQPDTSHYIVRDSMPFVRCAWDSGDIAGFFIFNHPSLNISRTLVSQGRVPMQANSSDIVSGSCLSEREYSDEGSLLGSDSSEEESHSIHSMDMNVMRDAIAILGGIAW